MNNLNFKKIFNDLHWRSGRKRNDITTSGNSSTPIVNPTPAIAIDPPFIYMKHSSIFCEKNRIAREIPHLSHPSHLEKNADNHYIAKRSMLIDLSCMFKGSGNTGYLVSFRWEIYTGNYWRVLSSFSASFPSSNEEHIEMCNLNNLWLQPGEMIRATTYATTNLGTDDPGNRTFRITISEKHRI